MSRTSTKSRTEPRGPISICGVPSRTASSNFRVAEPGSVPVPMRGPTALNTRSTMPSIVPAATAARTSCVAASFAIPYGLSGFAQADSATGSSTGARPYSAPDPMWIIRTFNSERSMASSSRAVATALASIKSADRPTTAPVQLTTTPGPTSRRLRATSAASSLRRSRSNHGPPNPAGAAPKPAPATSPPDARTAWATQPPMNPFPPRTRMVATQASGRNLERSAGNSAFARS